MNSNSYKIIFSKRLGTLVAVGEHTASAGKAASGQACRAVVSPNSFVGGVIDGFVGALRLTFASVSLACLSLGSAQAQSSAPSISSTSLPQGAHINQGAAAISTNGAQMAITQTSDKASINWQSFNIGTAASVNIAQPTSTSVLLNRVTGNDPSQILGKLTANGQLILLNPNGIVFGKDGSVTASTFTASTFSLSDTDFMNGFYKYQRNGSTASVVNQGTIEVSSGGFVALIGATVTNEGKIIAPQGDVVLAAAESVTLPEELVPQKTSSTVSVRMGKRVRLELDPTTINTAVNNTESGVIVTDGGQVLLQAAALSSAVASVTHSGLIDTSAQQAGSVNVLAENGDIKVNGVIKSNSSGNTNGKANRGGDIIIGRDEKTGALSKTTDVSAAKLESDKGFIETSGQHIVVDGIQVKAAQWLLDPTDITITSTDSGTASSGTNPITLLPNTSGTTASTVSTSTLESNLSAGTSVIVKTTNASGTGNGDITVASNIAVTGTTDARLTLQAERDIVINSNVSIARTGTNKLNVVLNSDLDGNGAGAIVMNSGSSINSNGGNITLGGGTAGTGADYARGYADATRFTGVSLTSATLTAAGGDISIKGKGNATFTNSGNMRGVDLSGSAISTSGSGNITMDGVGGNGNISNTNVGVGITGASTVTGSTGGTVTLTGTGTNGAYYNFGVWLSGAGSTVTSPGNINVTGAAAGSGGYGSNPGVMVQNSAAIRATGSGNLTVTGTGGNTTGSDNHGVQVAGSGALSSANGDVTITGTSGTLGNSSFGVAIGSAGQVTTTGGNVNVTATGQISGQYGYGLWIGDTNSKISVGGNGNATINAFSSATGTGDALGAQIRSVGAVTTNNGNINFTATSRGAAGNYNIGVGFNGGSLIAGGTGTVTLTGTGGSVGTSSYGVSAANITTSGGAITINGASSSTGTGTAGVDAWTSALSTSGGNITISADSYSAGNTETINAGSGTVTIQNRTAGTLIDVGSTSADVISGTLKLGVSSAELARITAATVAVGRNDGTGSGNVIVNATNLGALGNTGGNLTVLSGNDITVSGAVTKSTGTDATLTLTAKNGIDINSAIGATIAGAGKLNVTATANGLGGTSKGISIAGSTINANGGVVNLTGTNTSTGNGISFSGVSGINAATYTARGSSATAYGVYFANSTNTSTFTSSTGDSLIEGTTLSTSAYGLFVYANNTVNLTTTGTAKTALTTSATSVNGMRIGYSGGVTINTNGDVTIGSKNNNTANFFMQGVINAQSGKLSVLGKSATNNGIAIQDGGGSATRITGTNGAKITLDGESGSAVGVNLQSAGSVVHSVTSSGTASDSSASSITITGVSATSSGIYVGTSSVNNTGGAVTMTGTSNGGAGLGINNGGGTVSASGNVSLTGTAVANNAIFNSGSFTSTAGNISLTGTTTVSSNAVALASASAITSAGTTTITATSQGTGVSLTSLGANTIAATGGLTVDINKAGELTSIISGGTANAGGLTKLGAGTLTLSNANTMAGTTLVSAGTLALNNLNALQSSTLDTGTSGTQLVTFGVAGTNTYNIGGLQGADDLALGANRISVGSNNSTSTYSGILSGTGTSGITKVGTGNLTLSGASTVTGDYNADGGTLTLTGASNTYRYLTGLKVNINNGATVSIPNITQGGVIATDMIWTFGSAGGGTLNINANFVNRGTNGNKFVTTGGATNTINGNINLDFATNLAGPTFDVVDGTGGVAGLIHAGSASNGSTTQGFIKNGAGTLQLSGANNYKGPVSINAGTVELTGSGTLGSSVASMAIANAGVFKSSSTASQTIAGAISGQGSIIQAGTGAMTLSVDNTYSGGTTINSGSTLNVGSGSTTGSLGTGAVLDNGTLTFNRSNSITVANAISGTGALTQAGTGTTILTAGNTYGGSTTISSGTLQVGNGSTTGTLGSGAALVATGGNLSFYRSNAAPEFTVANNITSTGTINFLGTGVSGQSSYLLSGSNANLAGNINVTSSRLGVTGLNQVGTAAININSGASLLESGNFTLPNTLTLAGIGWTEGAGNLGALRLSGGAIQGGNITLAANTRIGAYSSNGTISGDISGTGKNLEFANGTTTLTGTNTYSGTTTIGSGATLQLGSGGTTGGIASSTAVIDNGTLIINHSNAVSLSQNITGTGGLTQAGTGTTTLTGSNAYGITTISAGTLQVGNGGSTGTLGTGAVTLSNNANLNFVRNADTTISNAISGTGNVSSSITGSGSDLTVSSTINLTDGLINLAADGNMTLAAAVGTGNTSNSAVILNAGKSTSAGTSTGGDLILSGAGTVTVGTGGRAMLMTGSISGSTGLATLVGTGNSRYNSDELSTGYTQAIGSSGLYAIYRESPSLTVTLNNDNKTYNALAYTGGNGYTVSSTVNGDTASAMGGSIVYGGTAQNSVNAGTYNITGSGLTNSLTSLGYTIAYTAGTLIVGKAALTATANSGTVTYNGYNQSLTGSYSVSGLLGSDTTAGFVGISSAGVTAKNAGTYTNTITVADQSNYTVTGVNGTLTIGKAALTATGNSSAVTYNGTSQTVSGFTVSGLKGTDAVGSLVGISASGATAQNAGSYANTMTVVDQTNYTVTGVNGTLTIGKAALVATANSGSVTYNGADQPISGFTVSGFLGTDTVSGLSGISASGATGKNFGSYTNTMTVADQTNYTVTGVNGTLSVGKANLTLSGTRAYDGTTSFAGAYLTATGVNNETFAVTGLGDTTNLSSKNVQSNIPLNSVTGLTLGTSGNGGLSSNYNILTTTGSSVSVTAKAATVSATSTTLTYNGATQQQTAETSTGFITGDDVVITGNASGKNANTYTSNLAVSGADAGNYNVTLNNANLVIDKASLIVTASQATKTYDNSLTANGSGTVGTLAGASNGNTVSNMGTQAFLDKNAGTNKTVRASGVSIKDSSNADVTSNYTITYVDNTTSTINKAALTVAANNDARFVTLSDAAGYNGVSYAGFVGGETSSVLGGNLSISRINSSTNVSAQTYAGTLTPSGLTSNNYDIRYVNGDYTIVPAGKLLIRSANETLTYGTATPSFNTTAQYLDGSNVIHTLSRTGTGNHYTFSDGAGGSVTLQLNPYTGANHAATSGSGNTVVGTYDIKDTNPTIVGSNFSGAPVFVGVEAVNTKSVTPNATNVSKVYDGTTSMNNVVVGFTGNVPNDDLSISGTGAFSQKNVGQNLSYTISGISLSGADAANYNLSGGSATLAGTNGTITPASLVISSSDVIKVYDRTTTASGNAIATQGTQVLGTDSLSGGAFAFTDVNVGNGNKVVTVSGVTVSDGNNGNNYVVSYANNTTSTITPKALTASYTASSKTYDGNTAATVTGASSDIISGDTVNLGNTTATFDTKNAGTGKTVSVAGISISGNNAGNYSLQNTSATTTADINKKDVTLTADSISKMYDGTLVYTTTSADLTPLTSQLISGDTATAAIISYANKNAGAGNKTVTLDSVTVNDGNNGGNYNLTLRGNATSTITPAPLIIQVNNTGMFVTQDANTATDQGFSYTGFKNGETATTALTGGALTISDRVYTGATNFPVAGTYTGVYGINNGVSALNGNYTITVQNGNLTVTPADKLLITILSQSEAYGSRTSANSGKTAAGTVTAEYCLSAANCNGSNIVSLTTTQISDTQWKAIDNTGSYVVFDTATLTPTYSTGGFLNAGNYGLTATEIVPLSLPNGNFTGRATNGGVLTITPRAVSTSASAVTKVYDGSTQQFSANVAIDNAALNDAVTLTANTSIYASKDAGNNISVTLNALGLSGADAGNYYLPSNSVNTTGSIKAKSLTLIGSRAANKVFDGNTKASITTEGTLQGLVGSETLGLANVEGFFDTPAVGTNKTVSVFANLQNGANGGIASNYALTPGTTTADITATNSASDNSKNIIVPPKPFIPTNNSQSDSNSGSGSSGGNGGGGTAGGNPYAVVPNNRKEITDRCTANSLEACACEAQEASGIEGVAVCYQPQKAASNQQTKARRI